MLKQVDITGRGITDKIKARMLALCLCLMVSVSLVPTSSFADDNSENVSRYTNPADPWEGFNRKVDAFNNVFDSYLLRPVAKGYRALTPQPVDNAVTNFFSNLGEVFVVVNDLLQLKFTQAASDTGRFVVNSTLGVAGIFDVASRIGLEKHNEDFGQTLGYWGVDSGPYLVLPFLGPSTVRDAAGRIPTYALNQYLDPVSYLEDTGARNGYRALNLIDVRADLIPNEALIQGDRYTFIRNFYLQNREFLVKDGAVSDDGFDEEFDEEFDDDLEDELFDDDELDSDEGSSQSDIELDMI